MCPRSRQRRGGYERAVLMRRGRSWVVVGGEMRGDTYICSWESDQGVFVCAGRDDQRREEVIFRLDVGHRDGCCAGEMICWRDADTEARRIGETASGRDGKASLWLDMRPGDRLPSLPALLQASWLGGGRRQRPRVPRLRVVESGVSVTATPSTNQTRG
jgi:hypothetical protein